MNDPLHVLTPELQARICSYIRAGGFPQIAAEAAGIPAKVFDRWMRYGQAKRPLPLYRDFLQAVRQAQAHARLIAETQALHESPLTWLKSGPGKETARLRGWTSPIKPTTPKRKQGGMSDERLWEFMTCLLNALTPFPEARMAASDALEKGGFFADPNPPEQIEPTEECPAQPKTVADASGSWEASVTENGALAEPVRVEPQISALAEQVRDIPEPPSAVPAGGSSGNVERSAGKPPGTETKTQPRCNEQTTKTQATVSQPAAKPASTPTPSPRKGPSAWDPLDAKHWIVFSSS
jgi:hypothetical protein